MIVDSFTNYSKINHSNDALKFLGPTLLTINPVDTGRKLNVHKTFKLRTASTGNFNCDSENVSVFTNVNMALKVKD